MLGIDLNTPIRYRNASLRYFNENERHVSRTCSSEVLLLVFEGTLRFSEDGKRQEVTAGEYYVQRKDGVQKGEVPSDAPKYLYVHFFAEWTENASALPYRGKFDYGLLKPLMDKLDDMSHRGDTYVQQAAVFFQILSLLYDPTTKQTLADGIAEYLSAHYAEQISLNELVKRFHFSRNHIINLFKKQYGRTPFAYLASVRIENARRLLVITSRTAEEIAIECGFSDYSHFYKAFKKSNGCSPKEWRIRTKSE